MGELRVRTVLDFGCGDGYWMPDLPGYVGYDPTRRAIARAKLNHPDRRYTNRMPTRPFDLVIVRDVIQHLPLIGWRVDDRRPRHDLARKYLVMSHYVNGNNRDIDEGEAYSPNMTDAPFNCPSLTGSSSTAITTTTTVPTRYVTRASSSPCGMRRGEPVRRPHPPRRGTRLADLAASVDVEPSAIVEIGTHTGLSTCGWRHVARAHIIAIDPWGDPRPGTLDDPFGFVTGDRRSARSSRTTSTSGARGGEDHRVALHVSTEVAKVWTHPVGLLFIDAIHTYDAVRSDLDAGCRPRHGGVLAFHDYEPDPDHPYHGVAAGGRRA